MYTTIPSHIKICMQSLKLRLRKDKRQIFSRELIEKAKVQYVPGTSLIKKKKNTYNNQEDYILPMLTMKVISGW